MDTTNYLNYGEKLKKIVAEAKKIIDYVESLDVERITKKWKTLRKD